MLSNAPNSTSNDKVVEDFTKFIKDQNLCQKSKKEQQEIISTISENDNIKKIFETLINIEDCIRKRDHPIPMSEK
tara:strand:+ start:35 stop:259 length:225 start_codon:yes stop_codon:yes gene_type:complete